MANPYPSNYGNYTVEIWNSGMDDVIVGEVSVLITDMDTNDTIANITIAVDNEWIGDGIDALGQGGVYANIDPTTTVIQSISGISVSNPPVCTTDNPTKSPSNNPTTGQPTSPTINPSVSPTNQPSLSPTYNPSACTFLSGQPCSVSGDPHTRTWNGARHDFQGQPANGKYQFYYIYPCAQRSTNELPFTVLGKHYQWGSKSVSGLDYITMQLYDDNG
eukprot:276947_1